jgi:hypothetical protein
MQRDQMYKKRKQGQHQERREARKALPCVEDQKDAALIQQGMIYSSVHRFRKLVNIGKGKTNDAPNHAIARA